MNLLQDLMNAGKGAVRAAGAPVHVAQQIGQAVANEVTHAGGGMPQGGQAMQPMHPALAAMAYKQALGPDGQPNGTYPGAGPNTTKIPFSNGFYAGPFNPNAQLPGQMQQQPQQGMQMGPMSQIGSLGAPAGQALQQGMQGGQYNPGMTQMQGSMGVGPMQGGQDVYWQNLDGARRNMVNPQVSDRGYFYDQ
jgi:hypothetical protein